MALAEENKKYHLEELNGSGYQIVEGEPDITGWDVVDGEGTLIGEVEDVLFDPQTSAVRYIIVDLEGNELEIETEKKVLIPIGIAVLRDQNNENSADHTMLNDASLLDDETADKLEDDVVYLPSVTAAHLLALPAYEKGELSPETEIAIRSVFDKPAATEAIVVYEKNTFYDHGHFKNRMYPGAYIQGSSDRSEIKDSLGTGSDSERSANT